MKNLKELVHNLIVGVCITIAIIILLKSNSVLDVLKSTIFLAIAAKLNHLKNF